MKFEDEVINSKTFEHASLIFTELWPLGNEILLNIMQNFKFNFLENEFWADWGVRFKFHFLNFQPYMIIFPRDFFQFIEVY